MTDSLEFVFSAREGDDEVRFFITEEAVEVSFLSAPWFVFRLPVSEVFGVRFFIGAPREATLIVYEAAGIPYVSLTMSLEDALRARTILHELLGVPDFTRK